MSHATTRIATTPIAPDAAIAVFSSFGRSLRFCSVCFTLRLYHYNLALFAREVAPFHREFLDRLRVLIASFFEELFQRLFIIQNRNDDFWLEFDGKLRVLSWTERPLPAD